MTYARRQLQLNELISAELLLDVAFPISRRVEGISADSFCCVIDVDWLNSLQDCASATAPTQLDLWRSDRAKLSPDDDTRIDNSTGPPIPNLSSVAVTVWPKKSTKKKTCPLVYTGICGPEGASNGREQKCARITRARTSSPNEETSFSLDQKNASTCSYLGTDLTDRIVVWSPAIRDGCNSDSKKGIVPFILDSLYPNCPSYRTFLPSQKTPASISKPNKPPSGLHLLFTPPSSYQHIFSSSPTHNHGPKTSQSPNIASHIALIESDTAYYFLSPYREWTLWDTVHFNRTFLEDMTGTGVVRRAWVAWQICKVLDWLHSRGLVHGCLWKDVIYLDETFWVRLAGLEFSAHKNILNPDQEIGNDGNRRVDRNTILKGTFCDLAHCFVPEVNTANFGVLRL